MNPMDGIDDRPPKLREFTEEEEKRILKEIQERREMRDKQRRLTPKTL